MITSHFRIAIYTKENDYKFIIGHVFIKTKFWVWGGEGSQFSSNNKYDQLLSFYIKTAISQWFVHTLLSK